MTTTATPLTHAEALEVIESLRKGHPPKTLHVLVHVGD